MIKESENNSIDIIFSNYKVPAGLGFITLL
jgi:hypothetical protein